MNRKRKRHAVAITPARQSQTPTTLQGFLVEHAARMIAEPDKRLVMVSSVVAQEFVGLHEKMRAASSLGAVLNVMQSFASGLPPNIIDTEGEFRAILYAYEFIAAAAALTIREVAKVTGGDPEAYPELDAFVAAFKTKRWGAVEPDGCEVTN